MKDYLALWSKNLSSSSEFPLRTAISVTGERDQHLGPRWEKAKIWLTIEPAESFEVIDAMPEDKELQSFGYPDWAIFGLLDVLMVALSAPVRNVRITLEKGEYDPIDSCPMAFRQAGRDAGRKIIAALQEQASPDRRVAH